MTNIILIVLDSIRRDFFSERSKGFLQLKMDFVEFSKCSSIYTETPRSHYTIFFGDYFNKAKNRNFPAQLQESGYINRSFCNAGIILLYPLEGDENDTLKNVRPYRDKMIENLGMEPTFDWHATPLGDTFENFSGSADDDSQKVPEKWRTHLQNLSSAKNFVFLHFWKTHHNYGIDRYLQEPIPGDKYSQVGTALINQVKSRKISKKFVKKIYADNISETYFEHIEKVFEILKENGTYESSMIIITADHGEGLGDVGFDDTTLKILKKIYGVIQDFAYLKRFFPDLTEPESKWKMTTFFHAGGFEIQKKIPLWVKFPDSEFGGRCCSEPVSLFDIIHTINEEVDYQLDIRSNLGASLKSILRYGPEGRNHYLLQKNSKSGSGN
jgi:hypothetical protein